MPMSTTPTYSSSNYNPSQVSPEATSTKDKSFLQVRLNSNPSSIDNSSQYESRTESSLQQDSQALPNAYEISQKRLFIQPSHPMITRAKDGIYKPKVYLGQEKWA